MLRTHTRIGGKAVKSLRELLESSRTSAAVWLALVKIGREEKSQQFQTTRERIEDATGVAHNGISRALTELHSAGWIKRKAGFDSAAETRAISVKLLNREMFLPIDEKSES
jgi:hypothetical protein